MRARISSAWGENGYSLRKRSQAAAAAAWERFLKDYPLSPHADEIRARIEALKKGIQK